jgi:hypothetical protein
MSRSAGESSRGIRTLSSGDLPVEGPSVFVPSSETAHASSRRWTWFALGFLVVVAIGAVGIIVVWPELNPRKLDPVERVAEDYLRALAAEDNAAARRLGTIDEPPAIRSVRRVARDATRDQLLKGSFAPLGEFHSRIEAEYIYDAGAGRFTPRNPLGAAAETMDLLETAKNDAEKSGLYKKMQSGDPNDLFDAAEQLGKVFTKLADGALAPERILPSYQMLVESAKPPLPEQAKALALEVGASTKTWDALLKRSFHSLKADGPFVLERAEVNATATDRLASSGDPATRLRLVLVRFRLEGIDTGWKVISARRILPDSSDSNAKAPHHAVPSSPGRSQSPSVGRPSPSATQPADREFLQ